MNNLSELREKKRRREEEKKKEGFVEKKKKGVQRKGGGCSSFSIGEIVFKSERNTQKPPQRGEGPEKMGPGGSQTLVGKKITGMGRKEEKIKGGSKKVRKDTIIESPCKTKRDRGGLLTS